MKTEVRGIKALQSFEGLNVGENFLLVSSQFGVANKVRLVSFDKTGLDRPLAYFQFTEDPKEQPFCIWQSDLNNQSFLFHYIF